MSLALVTSTIESRPAGYPFEERSRIMVSLISFSFSGPLFIFASIAILALHINATPIRRQKALSSLSSAQIAVFEPFTYYASAGYCQSSKILNWTCGGVYNSASIKYEVRDRRSYATCTKTIVSCNANPTFKPIAAGGDGSDVQFWYVGYDPTLKTVVVSHQGTSPSKIIPILTDEEVALTALNPSLFPGISSMVKVHAGFAEEHAKTAAVILAAVKEALQKGKFNKVALVGHSLGAALSLIESVYLPLYLPTVAFKFVGYGTPRVGNQAFATYVDHHNVSLARVNNMDDVIPILPGEFLGFHHPGGEKHIQHDKSWLVCPGDDNPDERCSTGAVANIFEGRLSDHDGPYDGVTISSKC